MKRVCVCPSSRPAATLHRGVDDAPAGDRGVSPQVQRSSETQGTAGGGTPRRAVTLHTPAGPLPTRKYTKWTDPHTAIPLSLSLSVSLSVSLALSVSRSLSLALSLCLSVSRSLSLPLSVSVYVSRCLSLRLALILILTVISKMCVLTMFLSLSPREPFSPLCWCLGTSQVGGPGTE